MELPTSWQNLCSVVTTIALLVLAPPVAQTVCAQSQVLGTSREEAEIRGATLDFYIALNRALQGDLDPLNAVWSHRPDVSNLSAVGGRSVGWTEVHANFPYMVRLYPGGRIVPRDIMVVPGRDMGYSVCTETGRLRSAEGPMVIFNQRATNIFRLEEGKWKLIHHHADSNSTDSSGTTDGSYR